MNQKIKYIGLIAILPLVMVALAPDLIVDAFAQRAEGSDGNRRNSADTVCGASLCSTPEGSEDPVNVSRIK